MLKKTITFEDFNGQSITEDFFFHLSKTDLVELEMSHQGGLDKWIKRVSETEDNAAIYAEFKKLILSAYGKPGPSGRGFIKTQELRDDFMSTNAFSDLIIELLTDENLAAAFVAGIIPAGFAEELTKIQEKRTDKPEPAPDRPNLRTTDTTPGEAV